jgi:A/G-specific adenine glycosylase
MVHAAINTEDSVPEISRHFFVEWYRANGRDFPWRSKDLDPFHSLITEMLLRKTRAEAVAKLWPKLVASYPDARSVTGVSKKRLVSQLKILGFGNQKVDALF